MLSVFSLWTRAIGFRHLSREKTKVTSHAKAIGGTAKSKELRVFDY
jgi:hypothetical protein